MIPNLLCCKESPGPYFSYERNRLFSKMAYVNEFKCVVNDCKPLAYPLKWKYIVPE